MEFIGINFGVSNNVGWQIVIVLLVAVWSSYIFTKFKQTIVEPLKSLKERGILRYIIIYHIFIVSIILIVIIFFPFQREFNIDLLIAISIIIFGNFLIASIAQILHLTIRYKIATGKGDKSISQEEREKIQNKEEESLYYNFQECFIRCSAGLLEIIFYTIGFAINQGMIIIGYLVIKTLSVWNSNDQKKDGNHTAVLRIAIILSLLISLSASFFIFRYLHNFPGIFNLLNLNQNSIFQFSIQK